MKPADFYPCYQALLANWFALSARVQPEMQKVRDDLHEDLAHWQPGQMAPDWNTYAKRMNAICVNGGLPAVFVSGHQAELAA